MKNYIIISIIFLLLISCEKKQTVPKRLMDLNEIIPTLKDSAYYYAYYKDYFTDKDTFDADIKEFIKSKFDKSKFIYSNKKKYLVIETRTIPEDNDLIRVYGYKKDTLRELFNLHPREINTNYEYNFEIYNSYIIVHGVDANGDFGVGDYYYYSYDYIYGFKKNSLIILDSIVSKHRENEYKNVGMSTILNKSKGSIINWKFISKNCILKEYESGEVYPEHRTDTIIFKPNSKRHSEKKCF